MSESTGEEAVALHLQIGRVLSEAALDGLGYPAMFMGLAGATGTMLKLVTGSSGNRTEATEAVLETFIDAVRELAGMPSLGGKKVRDDPP